MDSDLELAFRLADLADEQTMSWWSPKGVTSETKVDGSPVTEAERAVLAAMNEARPGDGFIGEETGERLGSNERRWIVDGVDGTRFFASGATTWGTLIALEVDGEVVLGVSSSPAQDRRWWATRGGGSFTGRSTDRGDDARITVAPERQLRPALVVTLPAHYSLSAERQRSLESLAGGRPLDRPWSHQNSVAEGEVDLCIWFAGDIWDHAAPSILVEEAGGRFSDLHGGRRLDTRTAIYSNGSHHDEIVEALAGL
jgi:histidinol-phosphatase